MTVTPWRLARVARAETAVRAALTAAGLTTSDLRVRDLGGSVRVEVDEALIDAVNLVPAVPTAVWEAGFTTTEIRLAPFHSGSLHRD